MTVYFAQRRIFLVWPGGQRGNGAGCEGAARVVAAKPAEPVRSQQEGVRSSCTTCGRGGLAPLRFDLTRSIAAVLVQPPNNQDRSPRRRWRHSPALVLVRTAYPRRFAHHIDHPDAQLHSHLHAETSGWLVGAAAAS